MFPKYNNYLQDPNTWDPYTKILVPISILGISNPFPGRYYKIFKHQIKNLMVFNGSKIHMDYFVAYDKTS